MNTRQSQRSLVLASLPTIAEHHSPWHPEVMNDLFKTLELSVEHSGIFSGRWLDGSPNNALDDHSPIDGALLATIAVPSEACYEAVLQTAQETFLRWRLHPAPKRGELIREIALELRAKKKLLGQLISLEMGKILPEGEGEVQEAIDIADYAVGLSRTIGGRTFFSEREEHRMFEQWHPLGVVGVITAFNFPVAVWAWNAMIAAVCGNSVVWKPSELTPLSAIAVTKICSRVAEAHGFPGLFTLLCGPGDGVGRRIAQDRRIPLVSATGSCRMGRAVGEAVAQRLGRSLLELGGNNAAIVLADADLESALSAVLFGAVGTAGQRCTSTRRVFVERSLAPTFTERLSELFNAVQIGNPLATETLMGPLVSEAGVRAYLAALERIPREGGKIICGGRVLSNMPSSLYVAPTLVQAHPAMPLLQEETFAPILYVVPVDSLQEAVELQNAVPQGLSSALFSESLRASEFFLSAAGSDCGIANVNTGTSGAEIGGAFGGEKETGGGRESGSDSWKAYMRRQTNTVNWGEGVRLAQGIVFGGAKDKSSSGS
ncbi:MAG: aldehyde dehydrogenase family protein [Bdellovibrionales bacterium]|nr:aldehyde dehydrogenase family protein [Bdellovibrionales bacterium]